MKSENMQIFMISVIKLIIMTNLNMKTT